MASFTNCCISALVFICHRCSKLPDNVVAFGEQRVHAALSFGDVRAHVEFSVNPHVVNRIELGKLASDHVPSVIRHTFMLYG